MTNKKRKQFLVEKQVQGALGLRIAVHWCIFLALSVVVTSVLRVPVHLGKSSVWETLQATLLEQVGSIIVLLALLPWFLHDALKLSNRFAGPMVRLRNAIRLLTNNDDVPAVTFRKGDFWLEMADDFNKLQSRVLSDRATLAAVQATESGNAAPDEDTHRVVVAPCAAVTTAASATPVR